MAVCVPICLISVKSESYHTGKNQKILTQKPNVPIQNLIAMENIETDFFVEERILT